MMNKPALKVLLLSMSLTVSCPSIGESIKACIGSGTEWAPYTFYLRENGTVNHSKLDGAAFKVMQKVFERIGWDYTVDFFPWKRVQAEIDKFSDNGLCELSWDASYKEERAGKFNYSVPLYRTHLGVFYSTDKFPDGPLLRKIEDINEYSLCTIIGYNYDDFKITAKTREVKTIEQALKMVNHGRCDFLPSSIEPIYGNVAIGAMTLPEKISSYGIPGYSKTFYAIAEKHSERAHKMINQINQALLWLQHFGDSEAIFKEYLPDGSGL